MVTNGGSSGLKFFKITLFLHGTTALLYVQPRWYWNGWPLADMQSWYVNSHSGQLSLLSSVGWKWAPANGHRQCCLTLRVC